jgi:hypothetical protein
MKKLLLFSVLILSILITLNLVSATHPGPIRPYEQFQKDFFYSGIPEVYFSQSNLLNNCSNCITKKIVNIPRPLPEVRFSQNTHRPSCKNCITKKKVIIHSYPPEVQFIQNDFYPNTCSRCGIPRAILRAG